MILRILYPNCETRKEIIITSSLVGGLLYLLLIIYQPFGTSQFEHPYKYFLLFPYAIICAFSFSSISFLSAKERKEWTIGSELSKIFWILLLTSVLAYFYNSLFISKVSLSFENMIYMFLYTAALGLPVAAIYVMGRYIYLNNKNKPATICNVPGETPVSANTMIIDTNEDNTLNIVADHGNVHMEIGHEDFLYAEAVDNYCFIHFYRNGIIQKEIIRISLTRLSQQVCTGGIRRVHRSFIVNLQKVTKYKGNASGYKIALHQADKELMVSRSYIDSVIPVLKTFVVRP